jgi:hypothetical protein
MIRNHFFMIMFFFYMSLHSMEDTEQPSVTLPEDIMKKHMMPLLSFQEIARLQQTCKGHIYSDPEKVCQSPKGCASKCSRHACRNLARNFDACTKALVHFTRKKNIPMFKHLWIFEQKKRDEAVCEWFGIEKKEIKPIDRRHMYLGKPHTKNQDELKTMDKLEKSLTNKNIVIAKTIIMGCQFDLRSYYETGTNENTIFPLVCKLGDMTIFSLLLGKNSIPEPHNKLNKSALHYVAQYGTCEMMNELLTRGGDANVADANGCTPLYYASRSRNAKICRLLLAHGADYNSVDKNGNYALDFPKQDLFYL